MRHGANFDPPNRFERTHCQSDLDQVEADVEYLAALGTRAVEHLPDDSASIVSENDSPDVPFRYSVNPYRGCAHGCAYCYARNTHEYLGLGAGLDFETKILVKHRAAERLRQFLARPGWKCQPITFSGVTDCYQPAEREYRLTRDCLQLALECRQPVGIITKNALVLRDLDLLVPLAERNLVHVFLSITTLDADLARSMEPRTSTPAARLRAVEALSGAGIRVGVMVAPIIPSLNDFSMPAVLQAARDAGAQTAGYTLLRLALNVEPVFRAWLAREQPLASAKVESLLRQTHGGKFNNSTWGRRMRGQGELAERIAAMFGLFAKKLGLDGRLPPLDCGQFRRPADPAGQKELF